jgi:hypothetical protein
MDPTVHLAATSTKSALPPSVPASRVGTTSWSGTAMSSRSGSSRVVARFPTASHPTAPTRPNLVFQLPSSPAPVATLSSASRTSVSYSPTTSAAIGPAMSTLSLAAPSSMVLTARLSSTPWTRVRSTSLITRMLSRASSGGSARSRHTRRTP